MFIWLDYIILFSIGIFCYVGYRRGFILVASDLIGLVISMIVGGITYAALWNFAVKVTAKTSFVDILTWTAFLGFYLFYWTILGKYLARIPNNINAQPLNCYAGIAVGAIKGMMYSCLLMLFIAGPLGIAPNSLGSSLGVSLLKIGSSIRERIIPPTIHVDEPEQNTNEQDTTPQNQP